jgi:hypothetical protein
VVAAVVVAEVQGYDPKTYALKENMPMYHYPYPPPQNKNVLYQQLLYWCAGKQVASLMPKITGPGPRPLSALHPKKPLRLGRDPSKPKRVFPASNFDESSRPESTDGASGTDFPGPSKEEEARKAARLAIHESTIHHSPDRSVITLIRGEFLEMERNREFKRQRKYLVSSDLSPQATYAMEWAIGTVLREGDTCWITQALGKDDEPCEEKDREQNCRALVEETKRLLKRTRLQVKIVVEVVAAKVPRHMITEMVSIFECWRSANLDRLY